MQFHTGPSMVCKAVHTLISEDALLEIIYTVRRGTLLELSVQSYVLRNPYVNRQKNFKIRIVENKY